MTAEVSRPLIGRCALITGSTAGIGLKTAEALAEMGADIVLNGFGEPEVIATLRSHLSERFAVRVVHSDADVSRPHDVSELVGVAREHGRGRLDILINNAGYAFADSGIESFDPKIWDKQLALNLSGPFHAIRCALPGMRAHGWGRIVNVASVLGLVAVPNRVGYVATKHALVGLTKTVALETAGTSITCNAICPGLVNTERVLDGHRLQASESGASIDTVQARAMATRQPSGSYIESADVASVIAFLCGPHAQEVRGAIWTIDGGWSAR
ncbi:3-hydroxybutyrate dehydrogenase [Caballeronia arationis]|uniref:3-hydroxybutyrate dehydrogenase n=1 Tax=Caballeronia arationis TaxID=1777142 RepID=A0A7Z7N0Q1_9BURK|nr:SDR family oxidoreductase [Caballeronia arationis]SOE46246.1 3-hydroxybutyrate dehydrogenase [Caballeronia arationis]